jgi:hypothetical protein
MIVDGKVRKMKFSEKVRENFERFKEIVERKGRDVLVAGIIGAGVLVGGVKAQSVGSAMGGGTQSISIYSGAVTRQDSIKILIEFWKGLIEGFETFGGDSIVPYNLDPELADSIYGSAKTREDSTSKAIKFWWDMAGGVPHSSMDIYLMLTWGAEAKWVSSAQKFEKESRNVVYGWLLTSKYLR